MRKIGAGELKVAEGQPDPLPRTVVLRGRWFRRAVFTNSDLRRADLTGADLRGARLVRVWLQGAYLERAQFQEANLSEAQLQGADLSGAQLQSARLLRAQLQGADLSFAQLWAADLRRAVLWRAQNVPDPEDSDLRGTSFDEPAPPHGDGEPADWRTWVERWLATIPQGWNRERARRALAVLVDQTEEEPWDFQAFREHAKRQPAADPARVAEALRRLACDAEHAPHVARGILWQILDGPERGGRDLGDHRGPLARALLDEAACPGARGLTARERALLREIAEGQR